MGNETFYRDGLSRLTDKRIPQKIRQEKDIISDPLKFWQKKSFKMLSTSVILYKPSQKSRKD